jgi:hypothetical protein
VRAPTSLALAPHNMRRCGARLAALALVICAASRGRLAGAQEDAEPDDTSRAHILAAALAATGPWRVFKRGTSGSCTPWGASEMQMRGVQDDGDVEGEPQVGQGAATACAPGGPALRGRDAERRQTSERAADSCAPAGRLAAVDERLLLRGGGVPGGALDGLHEHIEDGASVREPMPRGGGRSLDCLHGSAGARYFFGSPLAASLDVAGVAGLAAQYLFYHTFVLLVPSRLRRSDRAVGAAVIWLARSARVSRAAMPLHPRLLREPRGAAAECMHRGVWCQLACMCLVG